MIDKWHYFELKVNMKGGGGGGAGVVDYPDYMKDYHEAILGDGVLTSDVTDIMEAAQGNSPFATAVAYNPSIPVSEMDLTVSTLETLVALLSSGTGLDTLISNVLDEDRLDDAVDEFSDDLAARLTAEVIPRFEAGMRDINAVTSSAFAIGRAVIEEGQTREVGKFSAGLHLKAFGDDALRLIALKLEYQKALSHLSIEANRLQIVAYKEEADTNIKINESDALWDLQVFQYGSNVLASIGGGTVDPNLKEPSTARSVIGGALSGAAAGAMVGATTGPYGAAIGGVVGGVLGAASALL